MAAAPAPAQAPAAQAPVSAAPVQQTPTGLPPGYEAGPAAQPQQPAQAVPAAPVVPHLAGAPTIGSLPSGGASTLPDTVFGKPMLIWVRSFQLRNSKYDGPVQAPIVDYLSYDPVLQTVTEVRDAAMLQTHIREELTSQANQGVVCLAVVPTHHKTQAGTMSKVLRALDDENSGCGEGGADMVRAYLESYAYDVVHWWSRDAA